VYRIQHTLITFFLFIACSYASDKDSTLIRIEKINSPRKQAIAYDQAAALAWQYGEYQKTLQYTVKGIKLAKKNGYADLEASLLNNRGIAFDYLGEYTSSLNCYFKALRAQERTKDVDLKANILSNIGLIYSNQGLIDKSLKYHNKALDINRLNDDKGGISANLNNIAILYVAQKKFEKAIENYEECIRIDEERGDIKGLGDDYNNIGICYLDMEEFEKAMDYLEKALEIRLKQNDRRGIAETYTNIASVYQNQERWEEARNYYLLSLPIAQELGSKESLRYTYENLHKIEEALNNMRAAYDYHRLFVLYRDSIQNIDQMRTQTELELNYEYEKEQERQQLIQQRKDERARIILYSSIAFSFMVLLFFALLYKRWKYTKQQQRIIEEKTALVHQKNKEILDSITYAKRIQTAILPSDDYFKGLLPKSSIIYIPKDIVAGDFYWLQEEGDLIFLAVADCTGHGVPGAMMSVVCHNALNRALHEFCILDPGSLLEKTRTLIIEDLSKNSTAVADGMDISLCVIDSSGNKMKWCGANSPIWIYRKGTGSVEVIKGDKQPIGIHSSMGSYTTQELSLQPNDRVFLFTDGFVDQFGGLNGKKLMARQLKEWMTDSMHLDVHEQKELLLNRFVQWKKDYEQVDDVCLIEFEL
jgi:tetratricopeptide (TPR) repeat protein